MGCTIFWQSHVPLRYINHQIIKNMGCKSYQTFAVGSETIMGIERDVMIHMRKHELWSSHYENPNTSGLRSWGCFTNSAQTKLYHTISLTLSWPVFTHKNRFPCCTPSSCVLFEVIFRGDSAIQLRWSPPSLPSVVGKDMPPSQHKVPWELKTLLPTFFILHHAEVLRIHLCFRPLQFPLQRISFSLCSECLSLSTSCRTWAGCLSDCKKHAKSRSRLAKKRKRKGEKDNGETNMEKQQSSNTENQKCKENDRKKQQK